MRDSLFIMNFTRESRNGGGLHPATNKMNRGRNDTDSNRREVRIHRGGSVIERSKPLPLPFFSPHDHSLRRSLSRIASRRFQLVKTDGTIRARFRVNLAGWMKFFFFFFFESLSPVLQFPRKCENLFRGTRSLSLTTEFWFVRVWKNCKMLVVTLIQRWEIVISIAV